jgi:proteasome assembly chaperone (PAC2) family protein
VNEDNIIELPTIEIYYKRSKTGKNDLLILTGDVQPSEDKSSYEFSDKLVEIAKKLGVVKIITLGGVGLSEVPANPRVFCTGNSKEAVNDFVKGTALNKELYNVIGPIIGVTGIILGLAGRKSIPAVCILAETFGHPLYVGVKGGREILTVLNKKLSLGVKLKDLDKEIKEMESEGMIPESKGKGKKSASLKKVRSLTEAKTKKETSYIG